MSDELKWLVKEGVGVYSRVVIVKIRPPYAITANGVCLHLLVPPLAQCSCTVLLLLCFLRNITTCASRWAYFQEKSTLCNNFIQRGGGGGGGMGLFSRVGLFWGDYGIASGCSFWIWAATPFMWPNMFVAPSHTCPRHWLLGRQNRTKQSLMHMVSVEESVMGTLMNSKGASYMYILKSSIDYIDTDRTSKSLHQIATRFEQMWFTISGWLPVLLLSKELFRTTQKALHIMNNGKHFTQWSLLLSVMCQWVSPTKWAWTYYAWNFVHYAFRKFHEILPIVFWFLPLRLHLFLRSVQHF